MLRWEKARGVFVSTGERVQVTKDLGDLETGKEERLMRVGASETRRTSRRLKREVVGSEASRERRGPEAGHN